jgi:hypothetical protein
MKKVVTLAILLSVITYTAEVNADNQKVMAKCHVELLGGGEQIYFQSVKQGKEKQLATRLSNRKIQTVGNRGKVAVYNVKECVLTTQNFTAAASRLLEENQAK